MLFILQCQCSSRIKKHILQYHYNKIEYREMDAQNKKKFIFVSNHINELSNKLFMIFFKSKIVCRDDLLTNIDIIRYDFIHSCNIT